MTSSIDLFSTQADPYPMYALLREQAPVYRIEPHGYWAVSRYEDVQFVLKTSQLFSSETGFGQTRPPHVDETLWADLAFMREKHIALTDPPDHTRLRKLIGGAFTTQAIAALEGRIRQLTTELLDAILAKDEIDLVADFAVPLPVTVIAEVLGIDPERRMDFKRWSDGLLEIGEIFRQTMSHERAAELLRCHHELVTHLKELFAERRARPRHDLISDLVRSEAEEAKLTADEVLATIRVLLIAGNETTTNLIATGTHLLLDHPDALAALREDPSRIPAFLEETLRFESPAPVLYRRTTADVTLAGVTIPKDQFVLPILASANRDPAAFPDPDRFDIRRNARGHVAFGHGIHFCIGAPLSRLAGRVVFEEMLRRLPSFSRVDAQPDWNLTTTLRSLRSLRVRFDRPASRPIAA